MGLKIARIGQALAITSATTIIMTTMTATVIATMTEEAVIAVTAAVAAAPQTSTTVSNSQKPRYRVSFVGDSVIALILLCEVVRSEF